MGEPLEPVTDDINQDEQPANAPVDDFPDPDLDTVDEPESSPEGTASPVAEGGADLPAAPLPPPPPLPSDQGFTPSPLAPPPPAPPPSPAQPQMFTPSQLRQGVEQGLITEDQMVEQLQVQNRELAKQEALAAMRQETFQQTITKQLNDFRQLVPGWDQAGAPANQRVLPAYQELLNRGFAADANTELLALERTFGTVDRIKDARAAQARTASQRPTAPEVGRRGAPPASQSKKDPLDILSLEEKRLYKDYISKGLYQDWNHVRKTITKSANSKYNPRLREKHAGLKS